MPAHDPSSPTAALSLWSAGGAVVRSIDDLDDVTLARAIHLLERQRRRTNTTLGVLAVFGYPLMMIGSFSIFLGLPIVVVASALAALGLGLVRRETWSELRALGIAPDVVRELTVVARRAIGQIPRWVRGEERDARVLVDVRAALRARAAHDAAPSAAEPPDGEDAVRDAVDDDVK